MSFGKYKLGELDKVSFGLLNTSLVVGWHDYSEMLKNMLQNLLVVPMGTQTYDKKFERDRTHPQLAIGHSIFSTIA